MSLTDESAFRRLVEASFDGVVITENGIVRQADPGFAEMFGYTLTEVIGKAAIALAADESREEVEQRIKNDIEGRYEMVGKRKDGETILLEVTARNHVSGGRRARVAGFRDVTVKRRLEEHTRHSRKMEAVGRLAGSIAHDFNNMLTVIISHADLLLAEAGESDPRRADIAPIRAAAAGAASLTRQLLDFSRRPVAEPKVVTLEEAVVSARWLLRRLIGEDIELLTTSAKDLTFVRIDPGQLERVIMNLALNARDAMPNGGTLTIETGTAEFDHGDAEAQQPASADRYGMLAVSDTGVGMDVQTQARIFEPFFTTKELGKGTGLGLATVYGIVKQSGGFIWVKSEPGQGTTFKVYFPIAEAGAAGIAAPTMRDEPFHECGGEAILLVEADPLVRDLARHLLARQGYTVLAAAHPEEALALCARHEGPLDLLLTEFTAPGMSGRDLAQHLAAGRPDMRVLYMSGYPDERLEGIDFVEKPFTPSGLLIKVQAVLASTPGESRGS